MKKTIEQTIHFEIKEAAKALVAVSIDAGSEGLAEAVRLSQIPAGQLAPQLFSALQKMLDVFGAANPPGVGLTLGDIACDEARAAIEQSKGERP